MIVFCRYPVLNNEVDHEDVEHNVEPGTWRNVVTWQDVQQPVEGRNRSTTEAKDQREQLKKYFNSPGGAVPWQNNMIPNVNNE